MRYVILDFKEEILRKLKDYLDVPEQLIELESPPKERGEFALPCYSFAKELKNDPNEIAKKLEENLEVENGTVERAGPYLNFKIDRSYLFEETIKNCLMTEESFGRLPSKSKKILVEHTSANPNGPLHVGRARNPVIGDTLARIYEKIGYQIEKQYYVNDIGRQMAVLVWGLINLEEDDLAKVERKKKDHQLVRYYQRVNELLEEDESLEEEIQEIIQSMEMGDKETLEHFKENAEDVMEGIIESLERLNIHLDSFKNESSLIIDGSVEKLIEDLSSLENVGEEDGALYYEKEGNKTFIARENLTSLYPARDLAYHVWKAEKADELVNILGEDHKLHGEFVKEALKDLGIETIPEIIFHSFVTFEGKEMSTRKGTYVTLDDFMDTAQKKAKLEIEKRKNVEPEDMNAIAEKIGVGAVRYDIIKVQPQKPIDFKWEEALDFEGDSAPFIQYSYTRANSILEKWTGKSLDIGNLELTDSQEGEIKLIRKIAEFPRILIESGENNSPHLLAKYAHELAAEFNRFYRDYPVLHSEEKKELRIAIVKSFKFAMASVMDTLGLEKPKRM